MTPKKYWSPTILAVSISLIYVAFILTQNHGDPLAFAVIGTKFSQGLPSGSIGYDGQFAYQIALSPAHAAPFIDVPAYRYQRILYPILAKMLALGIPALIPWTLIVINVLAIGVGTWATERILISLGVSRWYALAYGFYGGQFLVLRTDLTEVLAQTLVQLAIFAWLKKRFRWMIFAFAMAALTKETTLIFATAFGLYFLWKRDWRAAVKLSLAGIPFVLWQLILWQWFGSFGVGSGGAGATAFSVIPLGGWLWMIGVSIPAFIVVSLAVLPLSIFPALAGLWLSVRSISAKLMHPLVLSLLLNSAVILFLPASTFREPAAMARLTQGLSASMLMFGGLVKSRRVLVYSHLWILSAVLLVNGTVT